MDLYLNSNPHTEWEKVVDWGIGTNGKGVVYKLLLVSCHGELQSSSLHIWIQRNKNVHSKQVKSEESIVQSIKWEIKVRVAAKGRFSGPGLNRAL